MAYPVLRSSHVYVQTSNSTGWSIDLSLLELEAGETNKIVTGDLILMTAARDGSSGTPSSSGYTQKFDGSDAGGACEGWTGVRIADATDVALPTRTFAPGASEQGVVRVAVYRADSWYGSLTYIEASATPNVGTDGNPDPPSITASWGAADNLFRACCAHDSGLRSISAYPSTYPDGRDSDQSGGGSGAGLGGASLSSHVATSDAGAFTMDSSDDWVAWQVVIRGTAVSTMPGSFETDAIFRAPESGNFTLDALHLAGSGTKTFTADAWLVHRVTGSFTAEADVFGTTADTFTLDADLFSIKAGTFTLDAVASLVGTGVFTLDAWLQRTATGSFTLDAIRLETKPDTFTLDATLRGWGSFTLDAYIPGGGLVAPIWVSPANTVQITPYPVLVFTMPDFTGLAHFDLQLDTAATFDTGNFREYISYLDQTGWEYWNGGSWVPVPAGGVPDTYAGNDARFTVSDALTSTTWYRRVRVGQ